MKTFINPVSSQINPDPYIMEFEGTYYCYATGSKGINLSVSQDLVSWNYLGFAYGNSMEKEYWAPSVIYLNGLFFLYYSSSIAQGEECLKLAVSPSPKGPFSFVKQFFPYFSIDSQPVFWEGQLFMFYSTNTYSGTKNNRPGTSILLDRMCSPYEFEGHAKPVVFPTLDREIFQRNRFGDGRDWHTIEGPSFLANGKNLCLMYSANAYVNEDYFINFSIGVASHDLRDVAWEKYPDEYTPHALLEKNEMVSGTGHNSVAKAPNLLDDWIVYHGRDAALPLDRDKEQRVLRIDRLYQDGAALLCFGPSFSAMQYPAEPDLNLHDVFLDNEQKLFFDEECFISQLWMKAVIAHSGATYGVVLAYSDEKNSHLLQFTAGTDSVLFLQIEKGISNTREVIPLPDSFDYACSHKVQILRNFTHWVVFLDDTVLLETSLAAEGKTGVFARYSKLVIPSLRMTRAMDLQGKSLQCLGRVFSFMETLELEGAGVFVERDRFIPCQMDFSFGLTLLPCASSSYIAILDERDEEVVQIVLDRKRTIYFGLMHDELQIRFGKSFESKKLKRYSLLMEHVVIERVRTTKN